MSDHRAGVYVSALPTTQDAERESRGKRRNGYTPCAVDGCDETIKEGPLFRVNPQGEPGVFMCGEHAECEALVRDGVLRLEDVLPMTPEQVTEVRRSRKARRRKTR